MRNINIDEIAIYYKNYEGIIDELLVSKSLKEILEMSDEQLKKLFTLNYKDLYFQVKTMNEHKTKPEISYSILKLRRLSAIWHEMGAIEIEGGVKYASSDKYHQFPLFQYQSPKVYPTEKNLNRIRVKALGIYVQEYNISDLRELRGHLKFKLGLEKDMIDKYSNIYKYLRESRAINTFATTTDANNVEDYKLKIFE